MKMPAERKGRKYLKGIIVTVVVLSAIAAGGWYVWDQYKKVDTTSRFDGEVACLPLRSSSDLLDKETCEKGLKSKDGLYFAVQDVPQAALKMGEKIAIRGNLDPVSGAIDDDYTIAGIVVGELIVARR